MRNDRHFFLTFGTILLYIYPAHLMRPKINIDKLWKECIYIFEE